MIKNGDEPEEPIDYNTVRVEIDVPRAGWEVLERFSEANGSWPLDLIVQAAEQRIYLCAWLMDQRAPQEIMN